MPLFSIFRSAPAPRFTPSIRMPTPVGRMPPHMTPNTVHQEMRQQFKVSKESVYEVHEREAHALEVRQQRQKKLDAVVSVQAKRLSDRVEKGYDVDGLFADLVQGCINEELSVDDRNALEEEIDWLKTRQRFFPKLVEELRTAELPNKGPKI